MTDLPKPRKAAVAYVLGALVLAALAASFGARFWWFAGAPATPALLADLQDSRKSDSQKAFIARLEQRFPAGSSEADMVDALRKEGFQLRAQRREASYDRAAGLNDICRRGGNVRWTADEAGRIVTVTGGYYVYCP